MVTPPTEPSLPTQAPESDSAGIEQPAPTSSRSFRPGRAAVVVGTLVALASLGGALCPPGTWYAGLHKPPFTPPDFVFPLVWTLLYILMAIAAWRIWRTRGLHHALALFILQLSLNAAWMPVAFGAQRLGLALLLIAALWAALSATVRTFWRINRIAGALLVPYLLWVTYAAYLNLGLVGLN